MKTFNGKLVSQALLEQMLQKRLEKLNAKRNRWDQIRPVGRELRQMKLELLAECLANGIFIK